MPGALARTDRLLFLTLAFALVGGLLVVAFQVAEAFNDPPLQASSVQSLEAYQDRARWFQSMQDIGQACIAVALPLALLTFAVSRRAGDDAASGPRKRAETR